MLFSKYKYRRKFAALLLFSYLFLLTLTVLHYHHVNMDKGDVQIQLGGGGGSSPFAKIIDLTHECTVQQFANTVLNYSFTGVFNIIENKGGQEFLFDDEVSIPLKSFSHSNGLRAPPALS